jgi:hypothetical protein
VEKGVTSLFAERFVVHIPVDKACQPCRIEAPGNWETVLGGIVDEKQREQFERKSRCRVLLSCGQTEMLTG